MTTFLGLNRAARTAMLALALAFAADAAADKPKPRCISMAPIPFHVDVEAGVYITALDYMLYAHDLESGRLLWSRRVNYQKHSDVADFGKDVVLFETEQGFVAVDKKTGRERWKQTERALGPPEYVAYIGESGWLAATFSGAIVLYGANGRRYETPTPFVEKERAWVAGWLDVGETLVLSQSAKQSGFPGRASIYFWDLEHEPWKAYDLDGVDWRYVRDVLPTGELVIIEYALNYHENKLILRDAESGALLQRLDFPEESLFYRSNRFMAGRWGGDTCRLFDIESGGFTITLEAPGHHFYPYSYSESAGKGWVLSVDDELDVWLWPVEAGAVPRKIEDRRAEDYLPGSIEAIMPPHVLVREQRWAMTALRLEDGTKAAAWCVRGRPHRYFNPYLSADLTRAVAIYWQEDDFRIEISEVFEAGKPEPLVNVEGYPRGLSPDGRFLLLEARDEPYWLKIVEVESGKATTLATSEKQHSPNVEFSPDSRYLALYMEKRLAVVSLEEGFPKTSVRLDPELYGNSYPKFAFSPDGKTIISQGLSGVAVLYDSESGEELRRFEEKERIRNRHRYTDSSKTGIWERAKTFAENMWEDAWEEPNTSPRLGAAFSADGSRVITLGQGQIIRVWDAASGESLRAIHTGLPEKYNVRNQIDNRIVLSPNGAYAFAYNADGFGTAALCDVTTGALIGPIEVPDGKAERTAVAEDGSMVYMQIDGDLWFLPGKAKED